MATEVHKETIVYKDTLSLAHEAVRAGLIYEDVLDHFNSLHPEVPKSMTLRYLKELCHQFDKLPGWYNRQEYLHDFLPLLEAAINTPSLSVTEDIQLHPEHASDLIEILVKYAYKWRLVGTALRFQSQDLDNIQANHASMVDSLKHNLIRLLEDWLQKKH